MRFRRYKNLLALPIVLGIGIIGASYVNVGHSGAASASNWKANRIIDDYNFYNGSNMSVSSIQAFLDAKVPTCDTNGSLEYQNTGLTRAQWADANNRPEPPYKCLKGYTQNIPGKAADAYCSGSVSSGNKSAARIIYDVANACNISPKVILITLQKEQSLITDDWPWPVQYTKATGMGCPDSDLPSSVDANNNGCYDTYEGFFNQIWYGARQFQRYKKEPQNYNFRDGRTSRVYYNPSTSCGYTNITMYNQATASLYNYTPYQPNSAALSNLYGTGNSCSAYGNRNFWRMYSDWFGNPLVDTSRDVAFVGDWDGDGESTPAIRRGATYIYDNDNDGEADSTIIWGRTTDVLMVGDWDGDGDDGVGLRRGSTFFLDNNNDGVTDVSFNYGRDDYAALVGDWDGDGDDGIGLRRGSTSTFFLDNNNDGVTDVSFNYGRDDYAALVGDWDGDGDDGIGLRRGSTSTFFLDNNNDGVTDVSFNYGRDDYAALVGDWDGDGDDGIGLRRGSTSTFFLDNNNDGVTDSAFSYGRDTDKARVGDWDGDGSYEIGLKRASEYFFDYNNNGTTDEYFIYTY